MLMLIGVVGEQMVFFIGDNVGMMCVINVYIGELLWIQFVVQYLVNMMIGMLVFYSDENGDCFYVLFLVFGVVLVINLKYECCKSCGGVLLFDVVIGEIFWIIYMIKELVKIYVLSEGVQQWGLFGVFVWMMLMIDLKCGQFYVGMGENILLLVMQFSDFIVVFDLCIGVICWLFQGMCGDVWNMVCG